MIIRLLATGATLALLAACSPATETPETGSAETAEASAAEMAPTFTLVDAEGVERSLADFRGRTVVLEWTNEGCPYVQKHYEAGAMQALQREATGDGVVWLTIISSAPGQQGFVEGDAAREWQSRNNAAATHLLLDPEGTVGRLYDAKTTPDMRIIDPEGRLLFVGGIDDRPTNKIEDLEGANNYVKAALADMDAGRPVATPFATPYGCSIKYADELEGA
ncbi:MAG: redoxin domain-containing protein [Brevundimonas sp.]|uniref:redoxin domain-containing protein n=1 Tax=Brevundimonas sp. TaxID=1871086 RepID=UPI002736E422|nr:redoxin domain-containing protein [Brevundimonas sp.]MDP3378284.1 redoxin domain-containing protein [Brevundimonas sp.]